MTECLVMFSSIFFLRSMFQIVLAEMLVIHGLFDVWTLDLRVGYQREIGCLLVVTKYAIVCVFAMNWYNCENAIVDIRNPLNRSILFVLYIPIYCLNPLKPPVMDNSETLELEILITISQNKNVPIYHFQHLFEHKWKIYYTRFKELQSDEVFTATTPITGMRSYELTSKGKSRITELIEQRESEINDRLSRLQNHQTATAFNWKTLIARLSSAMNLWAPSGKMERRPDYDKIKSWVSHAKPIPHKA